MSQVSEYPSKLFFFCEIEPATGGVYERMKEKYPNFVDKLEEHGLIYIRVLGEDDGPSSPIGRGLKSTFSTEDKSVAEERAAKLGIKLEWTEDGAKMIMGPIPGIKHEIGRYGLTAWWVYTLAGKMRGMIPRMQSPLEMEAPFQLISSMTASGFWMKKVLQFHGRKATSC